MSEIGRQDWSKVSANPIVDWGGLSRGFSDQLAEQEQARIAKRQKIDEDTSAALKDVQTYSVGNNANINSVITSGSDAYTTLLKNQYDLVKKGQADPRQFQLLLKNSQDSFGYLKKVGETWSQRAADLEKRTNEGINSDIEIQMAALDAGLEQFQNVRIMPNTDGQMYMYQTNADGSVKKDVPPTSVSSLLNAANTKVDKVDVAKETAPIAKTVEDYITRTGSKTLGEFTNNPMQKARYDEFANGAANTITSTPIKTASVLVDGMGYKTVFTEEAHKADPNAVYIKTVNGIRTPQITDAQKKAAQDHVKATLESQLKFEQTQQYQPQKVSYSGPSEADTKARRDKEKAALNYGLYVKLAAGGDIGEAAKNSINASLPDGTQITKIDRTAKEMIVTVQDADGNPKVYNVSLLRDGKPIDNVDVAQQLYGLTNPTNVIESDRLSYIEMYGGAGPTTTTPESKGNLRPKTLDLMRNKGASGKTYTQELLDAKEAEDQVEIYSYAVDQTGLDPSLYSIDYKNNYTSDGGRDYVVFKDRNGIEVGRIEEGDPAATKKAKFNRIIERINNPKKAVAKKKAAVKSKETPQQRAARIAAQK